MSRCGIGAFWFHRTLLAVCLVGFLLAGCGAASSEHDVGMLAVGAALPSGAECAARVQRDQPEPRPENTAANHVVPGRVAMPVWRDFTEQANQQFVPRIDGSFTGTTG